MLFLWGLIHIAVSSLVALAISLIYGHLTPVIAVFSLSMGAVLALAGTKALEGHAGTFRLLYFDKNFDGWIERFLFPLLIFISAYHCYYILYQDGVLWKIVNVANSGDLPLHINYIRAMSLGNEFPLVNPIFPRELLRYSYGMDLYNALWDSLGVPLSTHLFLTSLFCSLAVLIALKALASWWGLIGFFFSGGLLGWYGYGLDMADKIQWKNLFLAIFLPQRGFHFALPVGLFLLKSVMDKKTKISPLWFGFLWGSLGFFHLHSLFALSFIIGFFSLSNGKLNDFLKSLWVSVPLGGAFVLFSTELFKRASVVKIRPGWTYQGPESFWSFLTLNFGVYLFLLILITILILRDSLRNKKAHEMLKPLCFFVALFLLFFNVMFAPWEWDSIKVLIWPYLGFLAVAFEYFRSRMDWKVKVVFIFICAFSGIQTVARTLFSEAKENSWTIYNQKQIEYAKQLTKDLPRSTVFLAVDSFDHVLGYWGRIRFIGPRGQLWTHGINYDHEWQLFENFTQDDVNWKEVFKSMKIDYIYYDPEMQDRLGTHPQLWQENLKNISPLTMPGLYKFDKSK